MSERLKKIWENAKKTGFPLEVDTIEILLKNNWKTYPSASYFDEEENRQPRELDIKATKTYEIARVSEVPYRIYELEIVLMIECKQSQNGAWLFFPFKSEEQVFELLTTNFLRTVGNHAHFYRDNWEFDSYLRRLKISPWLIKRRPLISTKFAETLSSVFNYIAWGFESIDQLEETMTGVSLSYGTDKKRDDLYDALMKSTKASVYEFDSHVTSDYLQMASLKNPQSQFDDSKAYHSLTFTVIVPIIIFDGILCFWQGADKIPEEVDRLAYCFVNRSPEYFDEYLVPIVSSKVFETFVINFEKDVKRVIELLDRKKEQVDEQVRKIIES